MRLFTLTILVFGTCLFAGQAAAASPVSRQFGNRVTENNRFKSPYALLDMDGDRAADQVYLVTIAPGAPNLTIAKDVTIVPDVFGVPPGHPLGNNSEKIALGIIFGKSGKKYLITDLGSDGAHFFASDPHSIRSANAIPINAATRGSPQWKDFRKQQTKIKNDILVLGTEAGINIALYWNGKTFIVFWPDEEP